MPESFRLPNGVKIINVHDEGACAGRHCVIHNPSAHHMRNWPIDWDDTDKLFYRTCPHGDEHPDPDTAAYLVSIGRAAATFHYCDNCCQDPTIDGEIVVREIGDGRA